MDTTQQLLDQKYTALAMVERANEHLDRKAIAVFQSGGLLLALSGLLTFSLPPTVAALAVIVSLLMFGAMLFVALLVWFPADIELPGAPDWDTVSEKHLTASPSESYDQLLSDVMYSFRVHQSVNRQKVRRVKIAVWLLAAQVAGLLVAVGISLAF